MKCRDVLSLSTDYLEGELDERRASALRGHLRLCASCHDAIAKEAALRDAAEALEPVDPPPQLWSQVQARLAEAEIGDARRGSMWLWLPRLRQAALPAAVAVAGAVALALWLRGEPVPAPPNAQVAPQKSAARPKSKPAAPEANAPGVSFMQELAAAIDRADREYRVAIQELRAVADGSRSGWSRATKARFDAEIRRFERSARDHLQKLAVTSAVPDSKSRDQLYALYQSHIRFLQRAALGGEL